MDARLDVAVVVERSMKEIVGADTTNNGSLDMSTSSNPNLSQSPGLN